jgi:hypothetical protein
MELAYSGSRETSADGGIGSLMTSAATDHKPHLGAIAEQLLKDCEVDFSDYRIRMSRIILQKVHFLQNLANGLTGTLCLLRPVVAAGGIALLVQWNT